MASSRGGTCAMHATVFLAALILASTTAMAQNVKYDFEDSDPFTGTGAVSTDEAYSGSKSYYVGMGQTGRLPIPTELQGKSVIVTMMVFDMGKWVDRTVTGYPTAVYGPRWGVMRGTGATGELFGATITERSQLNSSSGYGTGYEQWNTSSWHSVGWYGGPRAVLSDNGGTYEYDEVLGEFKWVMGTAADPGVWTKWVFEVSESGAVRLYRPGQVVRTYNIGAAATEVFIFGGRNSSTYGLPLAGLYVDDITITEAGTTWLGLNYSGNLDANATNVDAPALWSLGLPDASTAAYFLWNTAGDTDPRGDVAIEPTAAFTAKGITLQMSDWRNSGLNLYLDKSLTMDSIKLLFEHNNNRTSQLRVGVPRQIGETTDDPPVPIMSDPPAVTLTLTGSLPLDIATGRAQWGNLQLDPKTTVDMTNPSIEFATPDYLGALDQNYIGIGGGNVIFGSNGISIEDVGSTNAKLRFTAAGGTVTLRQAGRRGEGTLAIGRSQLWVRSDQTWVSDPTAYIFLNTRGSDDASNPAQMVYSIDGGRLDNLGQVNFVFPETSPALNYDQAMRIAGGTYGSLHFGNCFDQSGNNNYFRQMGEVIFAGNAVIPPLVVGTIVDPEVSPYSMILNCGQNTGSNRRDRVYYHLDGHTLSAYNGILLMSDAAPRDTDEHATLDRLAIEAQDSTINVSNLTISSNNQSAVIPYTDTIYLPTHWISINGNAATVVNIFGDYRNTINYGGDGWDNLHLSTVNLLGGVAAEGENLAVPQTYEVGDASTLGAVATGTHSINNLNVGDGTGFAFARLVNDNLNDNPVLSSADQDKLGERLVCNNLAIAATATLDVNAKFVLVCQSLNVTGTLDLNTGLALVDGTKVMTFVGLGNQAAAWNASAANVLDSSNAGLTFTAVTTTMDIGNGAEQVTVWQVGDAPVVQPIEFTSALDHDFVYQNTSGTNTNGGHKALLTIAITSDANGNGPADYTVAVVASGAGAVEVVDTANPLVKELKGSLRTDGATGAGLCDLAITVTGTVAGEGTGTSSITVRRLGDINGDGFVTPTDKGVLNARLNGLTVEASDRALDVNADGSVAPTDKGLLNAILNGVVQP